ncbi:peroxiredoxin-5, mitochondrial-like isoform X2 [Haliotis rufescens]|uniref:peroxiredoxin-5, mitochondrial-like isoform X1 n=1 Tax=Haliotis rufescens TaxID=6454 RepID=UPI001EB000B7|nr:peroxiredoxin-5, mitochondrial-like isoform X1 [Haliotis rufescens]XP_048258878.1 peroxiredoxin-5, mitochondrial-like isoform X2 [Haliotis rufescens]
MQSIRHFVISSLPRAVTGRYLSTTATLNMPIKEGDKLPAVDLYEGDPGTKVNTKDLFGKGKSVIFAVPGAFTPTCSEKHAPGFIQNISQLRDKGVTTVACIGVNDPFVMGAWGKALGADDKVRMLADTGATFTKKIEMDVDLTAVLGGVRSKRYAMVVQDGVVKAIKAEPDNIGLACSAAIEVMKLL